MAHGEVNASAAIELLVARFVSTAIRERLYFMVNKLLAEYWNTQTFFLKREQEVVERFVFLMEALRGMGKK